MNLRGKFLVTGIVKKTQAAFFKDLKVGDTFELVYPLSGAYKSAPYIYIYQNGKHVHTNNASQLGYNLQKFHLQEPLKYRVTEERE